MLGIALRRSLRSGTWLAYSVGHEPESAHVNHTVCIQRFEPAYCARVLCSGDVEGEGAAAIECCQSFCTHGPADLQEGERSLSSRVGGARGRSLRFDLREAKILGHDVVIHHITQLWRESEERATSCVHALSACTSSFCTPVMYVSG